MAASLTPDQIAALAASQAATQNPNAAAAVTAQAAADKAAQDLAAVQAQQGKFSSLPFGFGAAIGANPAFAQSLAAAQEKADATAAAAAAAKAAADKPSPASTISPASMFSWLPGASSFLPSVPFATAFSILPNMPTITGLPTIPGLPSVPASPYAITTPALSVVSMAPIASPAEVAAAAPMRTQTRTNVLDLQTKYATEMPIMEKAGIPTAVLVPMSTFINAEVAWWNANLQININQVQLRTTKYTEELQGIKKRLTNGVIDALGAMTEGKFSAALSTLAPVTIINMVDVKTRATTLNQSLQGEEIIYNERELDLWGMIKSSFYYYYKSPIISSIFLWATTLTVASYVANDLLYVQAGFRFLGFFMIVLAVLLSQSGYVFLVFMTLYYMYRYTSFTSYNNLKNRILSLAVLPIYERSVDDYENANFFARIFFVYTLGEETSVVHQHVNMLKTGYDIERFQKVGNTATMQKQLYSLRKTEGHA